ncbi:hypothetical protein BCON_0397g00020 [Botryotinia convoluta]|uniref:Uncharacterized protein n=1 Tax=Botryotinia convoluta TaxID=54673 RepID=A0A4Z1HDA5_9HELO|nr:hypothetical protein BCON_0397g00020 [Botryotinia convoluta]
MSEHHPLSNSHTENKEDIPLPTSQGNQPTSTTLQYIMAAPFDSSLPKGYEAAEPTKALNSTENPILINDDDSNQSNTDQTKDLIIPSAKWKGKGKATEADYTCWEQEINAARTLLTLNLDIWAWSLGPKILWDNEEQRIVEDPRNCSGGVRWKPFKFITTQIVPPILHVSFLSRYIGLKYYRIGFGCNLGMPEIPSEEYSTFEPRIYYHKTDLDWRGIVPDPNPIDEMLMFFANNHGDEFLTRASKIYLYYFTDYICKRGPRDFRFTPLVAGVDLDFSIDNLLEEAEFDLRSDDHEQYDLHQRWEEWLRYGGLTWLKDGGPKPDWIQTDNLTAYDRERNTFFMTLKPWEEEEFIKRGVPNIGVNSRFWIPGIPEIHYMNLEIHG